MKHPELSSWLLVRRERRSLVPHAYHPFWVTGRATVRNTADQPGGAAILAAWAGETPAPPGSADPSRRHR